MLKHRFVAGTAFAMMILALGGCAKDKKKDKNDQTGQDGGRGRDGGRDDDDTDDLDDDGEDEEEDADEEDSAGSLDSGLRDGSVRADGGGSSADGGTGTTADGGTSVGLDSGTSNGPKCDVTDKGLGCGTVHGGSVTTGTPAQPGKHTGGWVVFDSDVEVDYVTGLGWYKVELLPEETDSQLRKKCAALDVAGIDDWKIPELTEVRTLGAGCEATAAKGACTVNEGDVSADKAKGCSCTDVKTGPNQAGLFCRPEITSCVTRWVDTHSGDEHGPQHKHWFYDVKNGSIALGEYGSTIAKAAEGWCVTEKAISPLPEVVVR